jgi:hypothetical protein
MDPKQHAERVRRAFDALALATYYGMSFRGAMHEHPDFLAAVERTITLARAYGVCGLDKEVSR